MADISYQIGRTVPFIVLLLGVVAFVDAMRRTDADFAAIGKSRTAWLFILLIGTVSCVGVVVVIYYLVKLRPRLDAARPA
jgi:hypothetical protein